MLLRTLLIVSLACVPLVARAADPARAASRFQQAHARVSRHTTGNGFEVDPSPAATAALQAQWAAVRDLVVALLDRQPQIALASLARQARRSAGFGLYAFPLDSGTLLVSATSGEFGTVFLLHRGADGRYRTALALDAPAAEAGDAMPELSAWQPAHAGNDCRTQRPEPAWSQCGPMAVERLIRLPNEAGGARRFAILGDHVAAMGGTERYQVSIWRWDGRSATLLLSRTLFQALGHPLFVAQDTRGFTLRARGAFQAFSACEECGGRQMIWRFDLPPVGAAAPRIHSFAPELDLVDRLYARLAAHKPTADLAAPSVIARLRNVEVNMLSRWRYMSGTADGRRICVDTISFERPQIFRIVRRSGKLWIADLTFAHPHACDGAGAQS